MGAVLVLGMHRSGTSAVSGLLHHNGIDMGEGSFYPPPMKENPKGFFEDKRFRNINDTILHDHGYRVKSFLPDIPRVHRFPINVMRDLVVKRENESGGKWGWKDPRTCLTASGWLLALEESTISHKLVVVFRSWRGIVSSMMVRGNGKNMINPEKTFELLVKEHYKRLFSSINGRSYLLVDFDAMVTGKLDSIIKHMSSFLEMPIENNGFIDPSIPNNSGEFVGEGNGDQLCQAMSG